MTAVDELTAVDKTTDVAKLKGSITREVVEYIRRVLDLEEESVEIDREGTIQVYVGDAHYEELKKVKDIHEFVMKKLGELKDKVNWKEYGSIIQYSIAIYGYDIIIELRYSVGSDSYGLDAEEIRVKGLYDLTSFYDWLFRSSVKEGYFTLREIKFIEKVTDKTIYNFEEEENKAYKKMEEYLDTIKEKGEINDYWDDGMDHREIILNVEWSNQGLNIEYKDVVEIIRNLEDIISNAISEFENELTNQLKEFCKKYKSIKEVEDAIYRKYFREYANLIDKAKEIIIVWTRDVYNKRYGTTITAFKILLHIREEDRDYITDLAHLMHLDNVKYSYLAKNYKDFVVSVIGSDRILEVLYSIAMKVYDSPEALKKANEWMAKVRILDR